MTIEIRQLIIRAVVQAQPAPAPARQERDPADRQADWPTAPLASLAGAQESELVARCTRAVLRQLAQLKER
ncbi:MAG: DUF5908 family protein [Cyanobacteriota bacterium]|jgi:hypothetical protein